MIKALAILIFAAALIGLAALVCTEHRPNGYAMPMLFSSADQGDLAKQNTWLTPRPVTPQNIPRIRPEEQA